MEYKIQYNWNVDITELVIVYLSYYYDKNVYELLNNEDVEKNTANYLKQIYTIIDNNVDKKTPSFERFFKPLITGDMHNDISLATLALIESGNDNKIYRAMSHYWDEDFESNQDLIDYLNSNDDLDFELKFNILNAIQNHEMILEEIKIYIKDVLDHEEEIISLSEEVIAIMKKALTDEYVVAMFEYHKIDLSEWTDINIYPDLNRYHSLQIRVGAGQGTQILWGVDAIKSFERDLSMDKREERFLEIAKILSDPTKLEIVKFCLEEEKYATEIAQHLNLSGATVSHHMNILTSNNYMTIRLDKKRVYYKTNVTKILDHNSYIIDLLKNHQ